LRAAGQANSRNGAARKARGVKRYGKVLHFHPQDNVGVAFQEINVGEVVKLGGLVIKARDKIPLGHKIAIRDIAGGRGVVKLGVRIGVAKRRIRAGEHVHIHNVKSLYMVRR